MHRSAAAALGAALLLAVLAAARAEEASVVGEPLSIAAFNVQRFGITKMQKRDVMDLLVRVLSQYDITLVQEIVDVSETAIHNLTARVAAATGQPYSVTVSPRVGRNAFEQYAYVYRSDRVGVRSALMYPDPSDVFEREPYIVTFALDDVRYLSELTLVGIHTQPRKADVEIDALSDVLDYVQQEMSASNVVLLGDFNAGCSYVTETEWAVNRLKSRQDVVWTIADYTDTTVSSTNCAYDRIVLNGDALLNAVVDNSIGPFRYDEAWGIGFELTEDVSDHYPVNLQLKPKTVRAAEQYLYPLDVFSVTDRRGVPADDVRALTTAADTAQYDVLGLYDAQSQLVKVEASYRSYKLSGDGILDTLISFQTKFPSIVSNYDLGLLRYKIEAGALNDPTVYEAADAPRWYAQVSCSMASKPRCQVTVEKRTLVA
ncbi:deoxyribonuclease-1-like [Pollicipes pollicipes]|uniref:deoxyribonuclease-1-like n=1 Tax=Pollicipes pollicipes TaxID=41117 RepID=UPI001884C532|nr:deoxyribonuclease-1-like [Pollicipes pollicipes]